MGGACSCLDSATATAVVPKKNVTSKIENQFKFVKILGEGASCQVTECVMLSTGNNVAVKRMIRSKANLALFEREVTILKALAHPNIVQYLDCFIDKDNYYLATGICSGGELFDRIVKAQKFTEKIASGLVKQMLLAIEHCHSLNIVHRDLKPENFVFENASQDAPIKLIDFGCARQVREGETYTDVVGTPYYLAPEHLRGKDRDGNTLKASDVWAVGVISFILVTGQPPFNGKNNNHIFTNIVKQSVRFPVRLRKVLSDELKDFIKTLLKKPPKQRPSSRQALEHVWVSGKLKLPEKEIGREVMGFLSQFKNESKLKKALADVVIHYAPEKDILKLRTMFDTVDKDGDGEVTETELAQVLENMGHYSSQAEVIAHDIMENCDADGNGKLTFEEFSHVHASWQLSSDEMLINTCFKVMDDNGDGQISVQELQSALNLDAEEAQKIFQEADLNKDGVICFDEFRMAMNAGFEKDQIQKDNLFAGIGAIDAPIIAESPAPEDA